MNFIAAYDSRRAAELLGARHSNVLRRISRLCCSEEFRAENFRDSTYKDRRGRERRMVLMTRGGLMFLLIESGHRKSTVFRLYLIKLMNEMERIVEEYSRAQKGLISV